MKIIIIEDNKTLCDITAEQLREEGCEVTCCYDGEEALYYIGNEVYDLIVLDRMLPFVDGLTILRKIRADGTTTPVLLLTAMDGIGDRVAGLDAGADDYLTKPFDYRELLARVRALARRPRQISQSDILTFGNISLNSATLVLEGENGSCTLSKKEAAFLTLLIKCGGETLQRNLLFGSVWGAASDADEASLDNYSYFVRRRLSLVSNKVHLVTVRGVGYRLGEKEC